MSSNLIAGKLPVVAVLLVLLTAFVPRPAGAVGASAEPKPSKVQLGDLVLHSPAGDQISLIPYLTRKAVVVVFWAAWCPVCGAEAPRIRGLNADANVKVIAVNEGDNPRQIAAFVAAHKVDYQVVVDPVSEVAKAFGVPGMPYCVIVGRTGVVVYRGYKLPEDIDYYIK